MTTRMVHLFFWFFFLTPPISAYAAQPLIGYGCSASVLPAKNQELFYMGFETGLEKYIDEKTMKEILVTEKISDPSPLGAIKSAQTLADKGVLSLIGFPTSHEALLAAKVAQTKKVLAIFAGAGHSQLAEMGNTVFTTGESMGFSVQVMLDFIEKNFPSQRGALITNPYAVFSLNQEKSFLETLKIPSHSTKELVGMRLRQDLTLSPKDLENLRSKKFNYIVITPYADESVKLMEQITSYNIDVPILTNSSWTTGDIEFIRRFIAKMKSPVYSLALWYKGMPEAHEFEHHIFRKYGREGTTEMAYGYDVGIIMGKIYEDAIQNKLGDTLNFLGSMRKIKCFPNTSTGTICFDPEGGHAKRQIKFVKFTSQGFIPVNQ